MKIRFKLETGYDCEQDCSNATIVIEIVYKDGFEHHKESFAIARRSFTRNHDPERARWAGRTIAAALRQLVPEDERYQFPSETY